MPREVRERQMLDAAVNSFATRGFRATSMDDIAAGAGVSKPLLYHYLNSKEDLFSACIRREAERLLSSVRDSVDPSAPADQQLWSGLQGFFTFCKENPDSWAVTYVQARLHGEPFTSEVDRVRQDILRFVTALIAEFAGPAHSDPRLSKLYADPEVERREIESLAHALVGAAESMAAWAISEPTVTAREVSTTMMNFAWAGLGNLLHGAGWAAGSPAEG